MNNKFNFGGKFDRQPGVSALVVFLEGHNSACRLIKCLVRMLCVVNEIAVVLLATRKTSGDEMHE